MKKIILLAAIVAAQPAIVQTAFAQDAKFSGLRAELRVGYETPTVSGLGDGEVYKFGNSASIGAELGYDIPVSRKVSVGPFINYDYARAKDCEGSYCVGSDGNILAGGRVGVALGDKVEGYFKLGYDRFRVKETLGSLEATTNLDGVGGELGANYQFSQRLYAGFSLNYADLGSRGGANFQRRHVSVQVGTRF